MEDDDRATIELEAVRLRSRHGAALWPFRFRGRLMQAPPVDKQPEVSLMRWGLLMHPSGDIHVAGLHANSDAKARISSPLVRIDAARMEAETRSGRRYTLIGEPDDDVAFKVACLSWGYVNAAVKFPVTAEEAQLCLDEPPSPFIM